MIRSYDIPRLWRAAILHRLHGDRVYGDCHTHIDALCHVGIKGKIYNGKPTSAVTPGGRRFRILPLTRTGSSAAGCCDIPRLRGVKWLEPGEAVTTAELEAAEKAQGVRLARETSFFSAPAVAGGGSNWAHGITDTMVMEKPVCVWRPSGCCMSEKWLPSSRMATAKPSPAMWRGSRAPSVLCN